MVHLVYQTVAYVGWNAIVYGKWSDMVYVEWETLSKWSEILGLDGETSIAFDK